MDSLIIPNHKGIVQFDKVVDSGEQRLVNELFALEDMIQCWEILGVILYLHILSPQESVEDRDDLVLEGDLLRGFEQDEYLGDGCLELTVRLAELGYFVHDVETVKDRLRLVRRAFGFCLDSKVERGDYFNVCELGVYLVVDRYYLAESRPEDLEVGGGNIGQQVVKDEGEKIVVEDNILHLILESFLPCHHIVPQILFQFHFIKRDRGGINNLISAIVDEIQCPYIEVHQRCLSTDYSHILFQNPIRHMLHVPTQQVQPSPFLEVIQSAELRHIAHQVYKPRYRARVLS